MTEKMYTVTQVQSGAEKILLHKVPFDDAYAFSKSVHSGIVCINPSKDYEP